MFNMSEVSERIMLARKNKGMTQMELANALGISYQAVSNWERGVSMPDISNLEPLASVLGGAGLRPRAAWSCSLCLFVLLLFCPGGGNWLGRSARRRG